MCSVRRSQVANAPDVDWPMASQRTYEADEGKLAPPGEENPATGVPLDPNVDSREIPGTHGDQAMSQGPGPQDSPPPQDSNQGGANVEGNRAILGLSFPRKLWMLVEDDAFASVRWNDDGDTVIIEEDLFKREVLSRKGAERILETDSWKMFIRLLDLYGFSKICPNDPSMYSSGNKRMMIYRNCNFQRDKPLLLENIKGKGNMMIIACPGTGIKIPKRKIEATPTRSSLRIQLKKRCKEAENRAQKEGSKAQVHRGTRAFILPDIWFLGNIAGCAMEDPSSREPSGASGEGTYRNTMFAPMATAARDSAGEQSSRPPDSGSVMSLYNNSYSNLLAAFSLMAPLQAPEDEEERESSDYKDAFCEHSKDSPVP